MVIVTPVRVFTAVSLTHYTAQCLLLSVTSLWIGSWRFCVSGHCAAVM